MGWGLNSRFFLLLIPHSYSGVIIFTCLTVIYGPQEEMSEVLVTAWTNFAKTGDPNRGGSALQDHRYIKFIRIIVLA